jgi:hypothetical protein
MPNPCGRKISKCSVELKFVLLRKNATWSGIVRPLDPGQRDAIQAPHPVNVENGFNPRTTPTGRGQAQQHPANKGFRTARRLPLWSARPRITLR